MMQKDKMDIPENEGKMQDEKETFYPKNARNDIRKN